MYLDLGRWITGSAWCSSGPGSIFSAAVSVQGNMGDSEPPGILCESCACIIHTNVQSCMSIISETLHDNLSLTSEESLTDSKLPDTGYLRTKGQESVYETCACVIHTILLSYMCINIVSHFTLMFARGTCAS